MRLRWFTLPLVLLLLGMQEPKNPGDYVGPDDPIHEGQPLSCSNSEHIKAVKHDCKCHQASCDPKSQMEDPHCYVYCRKPACRCDHGCMTE